MIVRKKLYYRRLVCPYLIEYSLSGGQLSTIKVWSEYVKRLNSVGRGQSYISHLFISTLRVPKCVRVKRDGIRYPVIIHCSQEKRLFRKDTMTERVITNHAINICYFHF